MTAQEQALADDKMRAEIARLNAETPHVDEKLQAEIAKILAETIKLNREIAWYPIVVSGALVAATATIVKLFF